MGIEALHGDYLGVRSDQRIKRHVRAVVMIVLLTATSIPCSMAQTNNSSISIYDEIIRNPSRHYSIERFKGVTLDTTCYETAFDGLIGGPTTLLELAIYRNNLGLLKVLLLAGADPNFGGYDGIAAPHWAAYMNDTTSLKIILEADADIDKVAAKYDFLTPLLIASMWSKPLAVQWLIDNGANAFVLDSRKRNALQISKACCGDGFGEHIDPNERKQTEEILLKAGLKP